MGGAQLTSALIFSSEAKGVEIRTRHPLVTLPGIPLFWLVLFCNSFVSVFTWNLEVVM